MSDLISREAAIEAIDKNRQDLLSLGMDGAEHILVHYGRRVIEELPTAERAGKWIDEGTNYSCSACRRGCWVNSDYCPWCGARMVRGR